MLLLHVYSGESSIILNVISFDISKTPFLLSRYSRKIDLVIFVFEIEQFKIV